MAKKRGRPKKNSEKSKFATGLYGIIIILLGLFGILGSGSGGLLIRAIFAFLFGKLYIVPLVLVCVTGLFVILKNEFPDFFNARCIGLFIIVLGACMLAHGYYLNNYDTGMEIINNTFNNCLKTFTTISGTTIENAYRNIGGGIVGGLLDGLFVELFDVKGTKITYWVFLVCGVVIFTGVSVVDLIKSFIEKNKELAHHVTEDDEDDDKVLSKQKPVILDNQDDEELSKTTENKVVIKSMDDLKQKPKEEVKVNDNSQPAATITSSSYRLPDCSLLDVPKKIKTNNQDGINDNIEKLQEVLKEFDIIGKVTQVTVGPACTQYELEIKAGTRLNKITSINKEISLALAKKDVRIQAPIPGTNKVGIEIANDTPTTVFIREIMEAIPKEKAEKKLLVALGKDIKGDVRYCEINKTPHMLVAGSTGSGKSVCINCILASILMRTKPDEVKLLLVDPKKVELSMYNGVPHLLRPVVTDPKKASAALQMIVTEMENRYNTFEDNRVKNIETYNEMIDKKNEGKPDSEKLPRMPFIVVIVDELADLMMVASKEVEDSIMRITQMARAAGIHLIIATQRPSTDVITGVIKANIPSRISFAVSSGIDSRTILDMTGAEKLLGRGDMLFLPQGENTPTRIQGAWITEDEIKRVVDFVSNQQEAVYDTKFQEIDTRPNTATAQTECKDEYDDPLYDEIVAFVVESGKASASLLQRRFRLGYNRAARVIDLLEERGIIGPQNGSKPREVLVKLENKDDDYSDDDEVI